MRRSTICVLDDEDYELAAAAVAYFTGSNLDITKNKNNQYTVYAAGYYAAIGS